MSGWDCIGIAKTGSGKTLAYVLPMLQHIKDQPPLMPGDGPVALIMAPTRELVRQINTEITKLAKVVGLWCVPVYGGSGVAQQIGELKLEAEIVVCTPGRMADILCTRITNARWEVTCKDTLGSISELTGAAIMIRGQYYPSGKIPAPGKETFFVHSRADGAICQESKSRSQACLGRYYESSRFITSGFSAATWPVLCCCLNMKSCRFDSGKQQSSEDHKQNW